MLSLKSKANWDNLWAPGFQYGPIESWSTDLFLTISQLLKDTPSPRILSAGVVEDLSITGLSKYLDSMFLF